MNRLQLGNNKVLTAFPIIVYVEYAVPTYNN